MTHEYWQELQVPALGQGAHSCLSVSEILRMNPTEAYATAGVCPHCKTIVDFLTHQRAVHQLNVTLNALNADVTTHLTEKRVLEIADELNLLQIHNSLYSRNFHHIIEATLPTLSSNILVRVITDKQLLDPHDAFTMHQIVSAIKRGVCFEYILGCEPTASPDAQLLLQRLEESIGPKRTADSVQFTSNLGNILYSRKDVVYMDRDSGLPSSRLVEIAFRSSEYPGIGRVWIRVPEDLHSTFAAKLTEAEEQP